MHAVYEAGAGERMSLKVKCPHCLEPNKLIELQDQIEEWDEQNNVSCKNCGGDFILRADYVGYEARNHFDTENYLKARGLKVPDDVSEHAVRCWLEQYFGDFLGRGPEYIPEFGNRKDGSRPASSRSWHTKNATPKRK